MKKLLCLVLLLLLLTGCIHNNSPQICATTLPVYEFTNALCKGTGITVSRLITENVSCLHDYTVLVSQMQTVKSAETVIISGAGLEEFLEDVLTQANTLIDASSNLNLHEGHHHEHGEHHHEQDPHIWLSPKNAMQMCQTICTELSQLYPQHAQQFQENLPVLLKQLSDLQTYGEASLKNLRCQELVTFHDGFFYLADSFHLHILKAIEEESGSEASAKELVEIIKLIESNQLPAIFTETNGSVSAAKIIAAETGVAVYTLDMAMAGDSYFEAMYHNIDTLKEALG